MPRQISVGDGEALSCVAARKKAEATLAPVKLAPDPPHGRQKSLNGRRPVVLYAVFMKTACTPTRS